MLVSGVQYNDLTFVCIMYMEAFLILPFPWSESFSEQEIQFSVLGDLFLHVIFISLANLLSFYYVPGII